MFDFRSRRRPQPSGPRGWRAYVIGDVHGRFDLLKNLLTQIEEDILREPSRKTLLAFVGDLIDRGPNSAQVVEYLRNYDSNVAVRKVFILGNHEEVFLRILGGDTSLISKWLEFGGFECLQSYGLDAGELGALPAEQVLQTIRQAVPKAHVEFLGSFVDSCRFQDFLFVHAGIRPGIELDAQRQADMRWIREPFLSDKTNHGFVVVHGHTITTEVETRRNRIGIDTGAYRTGILTALGIEGPRTWVIDTRQAEDNALARSNDSFDSRIGSDPC